LSPLQLALNMAARLIYKAERSCHVFKLKTVGDQFFCAAGSRAWNSFPPSLRAGALACTDATPGTVSVLVRCHLLATQFDGLPSDLSSLPATTVVMIMRKRADSPVTQCSL